MQIHRYQARNQYARVYVAVPDGIPPMAVDQDVVWERIKRTHYHIDPGTESHYWDGAEEEAAQRASWFEHWTDPTAWEAMGPVVIDSHF